MTDTPITTPLLIEPGARYFFKQTLKQCHETKVTIWNKFINLSLLVSFVAIIGAWMWWNYGEKQKKIAEVYDGTAERRAVEAEAEILRILGNVERERMRMEGSLITELPTEGGNIQRIGGIGGIGSGGVGGVGGIELPAPPPESGMYGLPPPVLPPVPVPAPAAGISLPPPIGGTPISNTSYGSPQSGFESIYSASASTSASYARENKKFI